MKQALEIAAVVAALLVGIPTLIALYVLTVVFCAVLAAAPFVVGALIVWGLARALGVAAMSDGLDKLLEVCRDHGFEEWRDKSAADWLRAQLSQLPRLRRIASEHGFVVGGEQWWRKPRHVEDEERRKAFAAEVEQLNKLYGGGR